MRQAPDPQESAGPLVAAAGILAAATLACVWTALASQAPHLFASALLSGLLAVLCAATAAHRLGGNGRGHPGPGR